jgi:hypothetical protein
MSGEANGHGRVARLAALVAGATLLAGCIDVPVASAPPTPTPAPEPTPTTTTYQLGTTVWYEGLVIHVDDATATLDQRGGPVEVRLRIENPGDDEGELDGRIRLLVDASTPDPPVEATRESKVPSIPAHGIVGALMTYELQGIDSVAKGIVLIGEDLQHVARIPLAPAGGDLVDLEPVPLAVSGAGTAGDLRLTLRSGVLRWDLPDWSEELPAGLDAVTLTYDVTYLGTFSGGFPFTGDNIRLRLPDGTVIGPRRDGHSQSIELIGARSTKRGLFSRFEIPSGTTGRFGLIVRSGNMSKTIAFDLGG